MTFWTRSGLSPPLIRGRPVVYSDRTPVSGLPPDLRGPAEAARARGLAWTLRRTPEGWRARVRARDGPPGTSPADALRLALRYRPP